MTVEYRILGPLQLVRDARPVAVEAPKQRTLLAVLLLHANEVVSSARLVDELWGERPPATALKTLQVYVSQLRKTLGGSTIVTRGHGYTAAVAPDALDLTRFRGLVADARRLLDEERTKAAAETYAQALALWRGNALSDVDFQSSGRHEADSLDELHVTVDEEWIDCELALGRHAQVLERLERLVERHPYRERLREQLMLALYRSGRQAEALEAYRRARRALVDDLGLEPAERLQELERRILQHDASLELRPQRWSRQGRPRRRLVVVAVAAVVLVVAAVAAVVSLRDSPGASRAAITLAGNSVVSIDPATNSVTGEIPIGGRPSGIAVAAGSLWVGNRDDKTVVQIDPRTRHIVRTIGLGAEPTGLAAGAGDVWVAVFDDLSVLRVDPSTAEVVARVEVPHAPSACCGFQLVFGGGAAWVASYGALFRIDATTNRLTSVRGSGWIWAMSYGEGRLWLVSGLEADLEAIDPATRAVDQRIDLEFLGTRRNQTAVAVGHGAAWTATHDSDATVWKIDLPTGRVRGGVDIGHVPGSSNPTWAGGWETLGAGALWLATTDGNLVRVDPAAPRVATTIPLGVYPAAVDVGAGAVWVATEAP